MSKIALAIWLAIGGAAAAGTVVAVVSAQSNDRDTAVVQTTQTPEPSIGYGQ